MDRTSDNRLLVALLVVMGLFLTLRAVPGVFTTDENNYLLTAVAFREGTFALPSTEGLTPAWGLQYYVPGYAANLPAPESLEQVRRFGVPPLIGPLALPFIGMGWRGFVALETLSFLGAAALVFAFTRRLAGRESAWLAFAAFTFGNYAFEYAEGLWPHMLAVFFVTAAAYACLRAREANSLGWALVAGAAAGVATGTRFQNAALAGLFCISLLPGVGRGWRRVAAYLAGISPVLAVVALLKHLNGLDANPIARDAGYYRAMASGPIEALWVVWAKVFDITAHPPTDPVLHGYITKDPATGALLLGGAVKKAWMQSSPWIALALLFAAGAFAVAVRYRGRHSSAVHRELAILGGCLLVVLGGFGWAGFGRTDGGCFNQRYLLELTPLAAIALALGTSQLRLSLPPIALGAIGAGALAAALLLLLPESARIALLVRVPYAIAAAVLLGAWYARSRGRAVVFACALGASFGWAAAVHELDDQAATNRQRGFNALRRMAIEARISDHAALLAYSYNKDAFGPLRLDKDVIVMETAWDPPERLRAVIRDMLDQGREVVLVRNGMPEELRDQLVTGLDTAPVEAYAVTDDMQPVFLERVSRAGTPTASRP